ncbi:MAG: histidine phosphatase family protein [Planktotalea sp.]|uniref:SixA phosphatase family protein n=1 Tax=Planktotalea sp. TaxID=2029877 RepID=UPI003C71DEDD
MSKTLIVMRHAKSSWDHLGADIERPLNERGRASASALGEWLRAQNLLPDEMLVSSAQRTQETAALLKLAAPITLHEPLYMSSSDVLMKYVQRAQGETVLVLAHNPGIGDFAERLAKAAPGHPRFFDYPTGATTAFTCNVENWSELTFGANDISRFITPRDLI